MSLMLAERAAAAPDGCEAYARDYAAVVAPRSGASTLRNNTHGYPNPPGIAAPRQQPGPSAEWGGMKPNENAYRHAYAECMARRAR